SIIAGLYIGLTGFIGDVNISALKRDLNIKDTSAIIPGHGGILDRVDSLTYTAPLFFHFTRYFYFSVITMKNLLFAILVRPVILFVLGLIIRTRDTLPKRGPCVIIANHNSHLDTLVLMSLFRGKSFSKVRPVA